MRQEAESALQIRPNALRLLSSVPGLRLLRNPSPAVVANATQLLRHFFSEVLVQDLPPAHRAASVRFHSFQLLLVAAGPFLVGLRQPLQLAGPEFAAAERKTR